MICVLFVLVAGLLAVLVIFYKRIVDYVMCCFVGMWFVVVSLLAFVFVVCSVVCVCLCVFCLCAFVCVFLFVFVCLFVCVCVSFVVLCCCVGLCLLCWVVFVDVVFVFV